MRQLTLAEELSHPFSLAFALSMAAWFHQFRREEQVSPRAGRSGDYTLYRAGVSALGWRGGLSYGVGRWPSRDRGKKALLRCSRA